MHHNAILSLTAAAVSVTTPLAAAETVTFFFPKVGQSVSYFMGDDNPLVGKQVINARIYLTVDTFPGSDAANFFTDHSFPIQPEDGNQSAIALWGSDLGWSGSGLNSYFLETTMFNGVFAPARYGAETPGFDFEGEIIDGRIEMDVIPAPSAAAMLGTGALLASRRRRTR